MFHNTRIQKLKQVAHEFSNPIDKTYWCKFQINIMWLVDEKNVKYFKISISTLYPPQFTISSTQLKECFKMHPLYSVVTEKDNPTSHHLFKFIELLEHTVTIKQTKEFKTIIQNLIQSNKDSSEKTHYIIALYKMLSNNNA
tara:strand:+ start:147 stop:569 length:423 start_codon:yes stop_codon:yes gene_type:complete